MNNILVLLQSQVLGHDQNFLPMLIRSENLGTFTNNENTKIRIEKTEEIVRIAHDVARLIKGTE